MDIEAAAHRIQCNPYDEEPSAKAVRLLGEMNALTTFHAERCSAYQRILRAAFRGRTACDHLSEVPALPVRLFKEMELVSTGADQIVKTLTSSGTTGQRVSRILLDKETASAQTRALARITRSYLGEKRLPMLIIDHPGVLRDRRSFSARGAGIIGFSQFGFEHIYALQDVTLDPDWDVIDAFVNRHNGQRILLFGFTFMIWHHLLNAAVGGRRHVDLRNAVLIHGGGWKKMKEQNVSNEEFKRRLHDIFGVQAVHNYYGMVEQAGSIYMECEAGYFHPSEYSEVLIRHPRTLSVEKPGAPGLIESFSTIPRSYPGHALLTEDLGVVHGIDGCRCSRRGTYFSVLGRIANAELRGCSDTHQTN